MKRNSVNYLIIKKKNMLKWSKQIDKTDKLFSDNLNLESSVDTIISSHINVPAWKKLTLDRIENNKKILILNDKQKKCKLKDEKIEIKKSQLSNKQKALKNQYQKFELEQAKLIKKRYDLRYEYYIMNQLYFLNMIYEKASILLIGWY